MRHSFEAGRGGDASALQRQPRREDGWIHAERFRQSHDVDERDVAFPSLDTPDVGPVQTRPLRERLLRDPRCFPRRPELITEGPL
jgi:hypothetical protein